MTPLLWAWLLSLTGAMLFFAAGAVWTRKRSPAAADAPAVALGTAQQLDRTLARDHAERASLANALETERRSFERERRRLEQEHERVEQERKRAEQQRKRVEEECQRITDERQRVEAALQTAHAERAALAARVAELTSPGSGDVQTEAMRHELSLTLETLRAQGEQLARLQDENARLRGVEQELERVKGEAAVLAEEARRLRAGVFVSKPAPRAPAKPSSAGSRSDMLQSIVDAETGPGRAKSAVIADELGLVVAASGASLEYGDALAAFGAYLTEVGAKTRSMLPLHEVSQVTVRDDHDVILTVRPIEAADHSLALVTLAVGANSEPKRHN
jgi:hypothetical protein